MTYQDIRSIRSLDEQTVIAIKAPPETRLEVPDPGDNIQIWLKVTYIQESIEILVVVYYRKMYWQQMLPISEQKKI